MQLRRRSLRRWGRRTRGISCGIFESVHSTMVEHDGRKEIGSYPCMNVCMHARYVRVACHVVHGAEIDIEGNTPEFRKHTYQM